MCTYKSVFLKLLPKTFNFLFNCSLELYASSSPDECLLLGASESVNVSSSVTPVHKSEHS